MPDTRELFDLFTEGLERDPGSLQLETLINDIPEWNSIGWLSIISLLDERYGIQIGSKEIKSFKTVNDVVQYVNSKAQ
jgi:acyl carrier protein